MSWIQTFTGKQFFPLDAQLENIDLRDIAHALSLQCRFNGHCRTFYSVAEHSVRVSEVLEPQHALWGLLHDAGEAYMGDLPRPLKEQLPQFIAFEQKLLEIIARHFDLPWPMPAPVVEADNRLLVTEARDLMAPPPASWGLGDITPLAEPIEPWPAAEAERQYLARYAALTA